METTEEMNKMEYIQIITVEGFDKDGEPEIRQLSNGSVEIIFNFMPPLNGTDEGVDDPLFDQFDQELAKALGVEVTSEDREFFIIPQPKENTVADTKAFLESFWETRNEK